MKRKPPAGNVRRVQAIDGNVRYMITNKAGRKVQGESHKERILALRFERDNQVKDYGSQPETLYFIDQQGKKHRYTPDFIVWLIGGGTQIHEVTISERREKPNAVQRENFGAQICKARGWQYFVHTPESLSSETELANLMAFYAFRSRAYLNSSIARTIIEALQHHGPMQVEDLVNKVANSPHQTTPMPKPLIYMTIYHLIWQDELQIDWQKLFFINAAHTRNAKVWLKR